MRERGAKARNNKKKWESWEQEQEVTREREVGRERERVVARKRKRVRTRKDPDGEFSFLLFLFPRHGSHLSIYFF